MKHKRGFTLIELLVVVLIIGILSAIALPQYEKAVEKSKATQAMTLLGPLVEAIKVYYMTNGTYPTKFDELGVDISWTGNDTPVSYSPSTDHSDWKSNDEWCLLLYTHWAGNGVQVLRNNGKYKGAGFAYFFYRKNNDLPTNELLCEESFLNGVTAGSYCTKMFSGKPAGNRLYSLP